MRTDHERDESAVHFRRIQALWITAGLGFALSIVVTGLELEFESFKYCRLASPTGALSPCVGALMQVGVGIVAAALVYASFRLTARDEAVTRKWLVRGSGVLVALALPLLELLVTFPGELEQRLQGVDPVDIGMSVVISAGLWVYVAVSAIFFAMSERG